MSVGDEPHLTRDDFLGGRVILLQPARGYRAGIDPVLLAAAAPARRGQSVLDLGCGAGAATLCLAARVPGLSLWGLEPDPGSAELARRNAEINSVAVEILQGRVQDMPAALKGSSFDHVMANPPYFAAGSHRPSSDAGRAAARSESAPLAAWIDAAARRLAPGGLLTAIQRADRLPDILAACDGRFGSFLIKPVAPRAARQARLVILQARKGGRAAARLLAPLVLHSGDRHLLDGDDYSDEARAILRSGECLAME